MTSLQSAAGAFVDLSGRTKLRLAGSDRIRFLNGQVSNDVRLASNEASIYTCVMTIKGKMCADAFIHTTPDAIWLDAEPIVRESLAVRLEKYIIADDVILEDLSDEIGLLHFFPVLADAADAAIDSFPALAGTSQELRCIRSTRYGQPGLDLFGSFGVIRDTQARLSATFALLDAGALETRRILAGVPRWGAELDENTMPAEAGLEERAVSFTKGCYIGQEVVSRVKSVGHVNRQLRGLRSLPAQPAVGLGPGQSLFPAEAGSGGREAGRVTSVAPDPADGAAPESRIALAFVRRGWETAGTMLVAQPAPSQDSSPGFSAPAGTELPSEATQVVVCELPFT